MDIKKIINNVRKKKYLPVSKEEVNELLAVSKLIIEENTYISDKIRLLKFEDDLILQEKTTKDEFLFRKMKTRKEAEELIKERLENYNRMWDGCGCKVDCYR